MISSGKFRRAIKLLGHPFVVTGKVVKGYGKGRELGFPTANLSIDPSKLVPVYGVYFATALGKKGLVNIGIRPTLDINEPVFELYLIDFNGHLYGNNIEVLIYHRIRNEIKFPNVDDLKTAIRSDIKKAKAFHEG